MVKGYEDVIDKMPKLEVFYENGLINKIFHVYNGYINLFFNKYPIFNNYDERLIPFYALYNELLCRLIRKPEANVDEIIKDIDGDMLDVQASFEFMLEHLNFLLKDLNVNEENYESSYEDYKNNQLCISYNDPKVVKFIKKNPSEAIRNSVHSYLLTNAMKFENVGLHFSFKEDLQTGIYIVYRYLYKLYITMYKYDFFVHRQFKYNMKIISTESIRDIVWEILNIENEYLFTLDEYKEYIDARKIHAAQVFQLVGNQLLYVNGELRVRSYKE